MCTNNYEYYEYNEYNTSNDKFIYETVLDQNYKGSLTYLGGNLKSSKWNGKLIMHSTL